MSLLVLVHPSSGTTVHGGDSTAKASQCPSRVLHRGRNKSRACERVRKIHPREGHVVIFFEILLATTEYLLQILFQVALPIKMDD